MRGHLFAAMILATAPACRGPDATGDSATPRPRDSTPEPPITTKKDAVAAPDPCAAAALGLGEAASLAAWEPPRECRPIGEGTAHVRDAKQLATRLECPAGITPGVDFTRNAVLSIEYSLSPAGAGLLAYDDGKVVTIVSRQRSSCPDDPMPMPMQVTSWFLLPDGGQRTLANTVCTLAPQCR